MNLKIAAITTLYYPTSENLHNINNYLASVDKLYIIDNTKEQNIDIKKITHPKIQYYSFDNIGVAKALNLGASLAINDGYKWLLTLDQDTKITTDIINELKKVAYKCPKNIGIITPWHKTKLKEEKPSTRVDYPQDVMTSGNLLNLDVFKKVGDFNEDFFIDGIDIEYGLRLKNNNYKIMRLNYLEMEHDLGDIFYVGNKLCTNHSGLRRYYMNRNYHYIYDMYKNTDLEFCKFLISNYKTMLKVILFEKNKISKVYGFWLGYYHYKKNIKGKLERFMGKYV